MTDSGKTPQIFVYHDLHPEDGAMLQALYSRSPASVVTHLEKVKAVGSGKFMSQYYVGYGHASIGDCGVTTIFMENYSLMAAKAIQDNPLYSGQEASTRYLDFSQQPLYDPYGHPASRAILDGWMTLYNETMPKLKEALSLRHPYDPNQYKSEKQWQNAVAARAFDILRGYLPIGCTTLFSWTTNLRQARDRLMQMQHHPLPEVQKLAKDLFATLYEKYPNSFTGEEMGGGERYAERDAYYQAQSEDDNFESAESLVAHGFLSTAQLAGIQQKDERIVDRTLLQADKLLRHETKALNERPKSASLNRRLGAYGIYNLYFLLDFGSYRDLQRHRNGVCQVPLVENTCGILPWYVKQIDALLSAQEAQAFHARTAALFEDIKNLSGKGVKTTKLLSQYLHPMGTALVCHLAYTVPQMTYVAELRSQATVHASLRPIAQFMGKILQDDFPDIALYIDTSDDTWTAKRGDQTIEAKVA